MNKHSPSYQKLCAEYYELDKPTAPPELLACYLIYASEIIGPILEPMCGTGRYLIPLLEKNFSVTGFDSSSHMLEICRLKCQEKGLKPILEKANFESFMRADLYSLILIPSGSFCLLKTPKEVQQALHCIKKWLNPNGKFVFEVEFTNATTHNPGQWKGNWVEKKDGSKIVLNTLSKFNPSTQIETTLCRYELWENNAISKVEVEDFHLKLYERDEIEHMLKSNGFQVACKRQIEPFLSDEITEDASVILYECIHDK